MSELKIEPATNTTFYVPPEAFFSVHAQPNKWMWDVFGGGLMVVNLQFDPPLWRRVLTRILLGSKWERLS